MEKQEQHIDRRPSAMAELYETELKIAECIITRVEAEPEIYSQPTNSTDLTPILQDECGIDSPALVRNALLVGQALGKVSAFRIGPQDSPHQLHKPIYSITTAKIN